MNIKDWKQILEQRNQRERWLILITAMVFIYFIIDIVAFSPLMSQVKTHQTIIASKNQAMQTQQEAMAQKELLNKNADAGFSEKVELIKEKIKKHESLVQSSLMGENTIELLSALLKNSPMVQSLTSLPPVKVEHFDTLYRHTVEVALEGKYLEIQSFMQSIERLPVPLALDTFHYQVTQHPKASLTLTLTFLSANPNLDRLAP